MLPRTRSVWQSNERRQKNSRIGPQFCKGILQDRKGSQKARRLWASHGNVLQGNQHAARPDHIERAWGHTIAKQIQDSVGRTHFQRRVPRSFEKNKQHSWSKPSWCYSHSEKNCASLQQWRAWKGTANFGPKKIRNCFLKNRNATFFIRRDFLP